ncbi:hypothetical protein Lfu02_72520 [Longispora fulva]|uniref:AraC-like DNA-binding protein/mannose-6-phosphate isomerase-like protein (Cupin superfamily) n=1 Tax=Longispora fulva TaxID=619741 RepID=A0A8J7GAL7_9ACTN|nr:AraC family transcriptional regulator [Longispora fulva]MBG6133841.1 AraC-like DNA-binding protein/mannose-6-phosphate isomerase-like protein (cupin superfamily) [Longispora fulva]GIG62880.1 hypothetical protein Lfu02_72520 [Longispora fulva]
MRESAYLAPGARVPDTPDRSGADVDYADPGVWDRLGAALRGPWAPVVRPGGGQVLCEPAWSWRQRLPDFDLWCVLGGRGRATVSGERVDLAVGTVLLLRPQDTVHAEQDPQDRLTVSYQHFAYGSGDPAAFPDGLLPPRVLHLDDLASVRHLLPEVHQCLRQPGPDTAVRGTALLSTLLLKLHACAARTAGALAAPLDPRVATVVRWLREHPADRPDLADAAGHVGLSPVGFSRLFSAKTRTSFREFCVQVRVERACELLREGSFTVDRVARMLGYADRRLFVRQFRARIGTSPGAWRRDA